ncbi:hypothetical protein ACIBHX_46215 [Nonomuraea sp. NPDC050536]|uniref:hypothetical protein n=1 Tax=Nonomuraea sp. NPDC050536 TaxID=3364366 RepID=UPI0037C71DE8
MPNAVSASFAVTGYPREVGAGWLEPRLTYLGHLDVSLHIEPIPQQVAAMRLRRQLARLESASRSDAQYGRLQDLGAEAAADDATDLADSLARGHGRLFKVGLYLTIHAPTEPELAAEVERIRALASSLLLDARPATFRALQGWTTGLPLGVDSLGATRTFDTTALAAAFPFTSPDLATEAGETSRVGRAGRDRGVRSDAGQVLRHYKGQEAVERRYQAFKGPLAVTSLYLKSNRRIAALITVICLALLIFCLIERQVRDALAARGAAKVDGLYAGRPAVPTGKLVLDALASIRLIPGTGQSPPTIPQPTDLQLDLLDLLDIDPRDLR